MPSHSKEKQQGSKIGTLPIGLAPFKGLMKIGSFMQISVGGSTFQTKPGLANGFGQMNLVGAGQVSPYIHSFGGIMPVTGSIGWQKRMGRIYSGTMQHPHRNSSSFPSHNGKGIKMDLFFLRHIFFCVSLGSF